MPRVRAAVVLLIAALAACAAAVPAGADGDRWSQHSLRSPVSDENFYFVMADRFENGDKGNDLGGLPAPKMESGFDPKDRGFYHGGDLKGLLAQIDYIQGLGTDSIWLTPSFKNKAVQPEDRSAGYHGYWITDFTQIDPHLGTNDDLRALVDEAHKRGMKVYFDIITNHTADVIGYAEGARKAYVGKDERPYLDASGAAFDDRDFAGGSTFPALDAATSFPYRPVLDPPETDLKVPAWLNDVTLYHNRGDTTFVGEDSLYGDFFGLDDLFTEHPRVVRGMIDVYKRWIGDFGVDGFRIDTMKHVNDEFWRQFGPEVLAYARAQGKREFFMFGEVFDTRQSFTSHFTTSDRMQAVLDFPFQAAAQGFAADSKATDELRTFFENDDWYTDADSNAYQLPTFLGNHDMGRIGRFIDVANAGASDAERLARDRLAHELMYLSRGNPVVYYGDEQGFVGDGGDQLARQDMFASEVPEYNDDDLIGTDSTTAMANFDTRHPLYRGIARLAALTRAHPVLRDGAHQHRFSNAGPGVYAFSRLDRRRQREYVVALNNAEVPKIAAIPTYVDRGVFRRVYGDGPDRLRSDRGRNLTVTVPALSAVVYKLAGRIPRSRRAPSVALAAPTPAAAAHSRIEVGAGVGGVSFYEVTFLARSGDGGWEPIGTDDNAPYRVFHDVGGLKPGTPLRYKAVVLDNRGHTRTSAVRSTVVPAPTLTIEAPPEGSRQRDRVQLRAVADPDRATHSVTFERSVAGGPWTPVGTDSSSPAYVVVDGIAHLAAGTQVAYRATLSEPDGTRVTSAVRTIAVAGPPLSTAVVHYLRPAGDYGDWGLHVFGDAVQVQGDWNHPLQPAGFDAYGARFVIALKDDTKPVKFIVHRPGGDVVPDTREPGGDRSFVPLQHPEIWLKQGDPVVYTNQPATG
ncbi:MAG: alpha-amylase family glycosyl hydrolase [Solirubrobacteraceae bacterium]